SRARRARSSRVPTRGSRRDRCRPRSAAMARRGGGGRGGRGGAGGAGGAGGGGAGGAGGAGGTGGIGGIGGSIGGAGAGGSAYCPRVDEVGDDAPSTTPPPAIPTAGFPFSCQSMPEAFLFPPPG